MQFVLFLLFIIVGLAPMVIMEHVAHRYYREAILGDVKAGLQTQAAALAGEIGQYQDVSLSRIDSYSSIIRQYSTFNDARVMLVDTGYVIEYDTFSVERGKTLISTNVVDVFSTKKTSSSYNKGSGSIEVVTPVTDQDKNVIAVVVMEADAGEKLQFTSELSQKTYVVKISVFTVLIILAWILSRALVYPQKRITEQVSDIAMGHYDRRVEPVGLTEYNAMIGELNDILDKMNKLDESRQEFVSNVSHELKTPITSMKVLADSLNTQEDVPIELYREFMQDIVAEVDRESKIIDDLLSLVRMDKSSNAMKIASVNINELLELILKRLKPIAQKKNIELVFESFRPVVADVDEVKFTISISNLVENAIKYNNDDGWVHVSLNADHQYFYVRVEDNGIGIPQESQKMVFERFYRVDKARSRATGGTGLGLSIVRNCILMHHGAIRLHSEENVGTTFTVRIPLNYIKDEPAAEDAVGE
jgi:signal transduction histidine kinase